MIKQIIITAILLSALLFSFGCGVSDQVQKAVTGSGNSNSPNSNADNKAIVDKAIDTAFGGEKIGVKECDDLYDYVAELVTKGENEGYAAKAARQYFLNRIRERIKTSIEQNKNDKAQMATDCKDYRRQIDVFITQQPNEK
jgi:hypothetical protein